MRRFALLLAIWSLLGALSCAYLYYSENGIFPSLSTEWDLLLASVLLANFVGWSVRFSDNILNKLVSWRSLFLTRLFTGILINTILAALLIFVVGTAWIKMTGNTPMDVFYLKWHEEIWKLCILLLISVFLYEIFYGWFYSYRYFATVQVDQLQSERVQMELQFESLKSQISPHYLFNCLNTISSLLYNDDGTAEEFIRRMADTFRYVISNQQKQLVALHEEIEFVKAYYYLLQVRYQSHLQLEVNLPANIMDSYVPPLAIQILVENAVKHNEISKAHPLFIYLSAQDNTFINISSTKTIKSKTAESFKIGLDNIQSRYKFFTDEKVVVKDNDKFVVQLPVIKENQSGPKLESETSQITTLV